jgi:hypothetical protein
MRPPHSGFVQVGIAEVNWRFEIYADKEKNKIYLA